MLSRVIEGQGLLFQQEKLLKLYFFSLAFGFCLISSFFSFMNYGNFPNGQELLRPVGLNFCQCANTLFLLSRTLLLAESGRQQTSLSAEKALDFPQAEQKGSFFQSRSVQSGTGVSLESSFFYLACGPILFDWYQQSLKYLLVMLPCELVVMFFRLPAVTRPSAFLNLRGSSFGSFMST